MDTAIRVILTPAATPGRSSLVRDVFLRYTMKVGRAVPGKSMPSKDNFIFDSKVLSRSHAEIWADDAKVFVKDTKSSNGTFVNDERLSASGEESPPHELKNGDRLTLGVDVTENNVAAHKCVQLEVTILGAPTPGPSVDEAPTKIEDLTALSKDVLVEELLRLRQDRTVAAIKTQELTRSITEGLQQQTKLETHLTHLMQIMVTLQDKAEKKYHTNIQEDKLLSRIDAMENQLIFYQNRSKRLNKDGEGGVLSLVVDAQNEKHRYEMLAKESVRRIMVEKQEAIQKCASLQRAHQVTQQMLERDLEALKQRNDTLVLSETELNNKVSLLEAQISENETRHASELQALQDKLAGLEAQDPEVPALKEVITAQAAQLKEHDLLQQQYESQLNVQRQLEMELAKMEQDLEAAQRQLAQAAKPVIVDKDREPTEHATSEALTAVQRALALKEEELQAKTARVQTLELEFGATKASVELLQTESAAKTSQISDLHREIEDVLSKNTAIQQNLVETFDLNTALNARIQELQSTQKRTVEQLGLKHKEESLDLQSQLQRSNDVIKAAYDQIEETRRNLENKSKQYEAIVQQVDGLKLANNNNIPLGRLYLYSTLIALVAFLIAMAIL